LTALLTTVTVTDAFLSMDLRKLAIMAAFDSIMKPNNMNRTKNTRPVQVGASKENCVVQVALKSSMYTLSDSASFPRTEAIAP
jgi:hypothetical protein